MNGLAFQTLQDQVKITPANRSYSQVEFCIQQHISQAEHLLNARKRPALACRFEESFEDDQETTRLVNSNLCPQIHARH